jgi:hypothetical protein
MFFSLFPSLSKLSENLRECYVAVLRGDGGTKFSRQVLVFLYQRPDDLRGVVAVTPAARVKPVHQFRNCVCV